MELFLSIYSIVFLDIYHGVTHFLGYHFATSRLHAQAAFGATTPGGADGREGDGTPGGGSDGVLCFLLMCFGMKKNTKQTHQKWQ